MELEEGKKVKGKWEVVTDNLEEAKKIRMEPGKVYQYEWNVRTRIPLPPFLEQLRLKIIAKVAALQQQIKGLKVLWWRITDDELIMQVTKEPEEQVGVVIIALSAIAITTALIFAGIGIYLVFRIVKTLVEKFEEAAEETPWLGGLLTVGIILGSVYIISKEFAPKRE